MIGFGGALYTELWKLCAGPLVDVPSPGERVFYFPQGHMEQVQTFNPLNPLFYFWVFTLFLTRSKSVSLVFLHLYAFSGFWKLLSFFFLQLEASTNQELNPQIPRFNISSKILCRVVNIQLLVLCFRSQFPSKSMYFSCFLVSSGKLLKRLQIQIWLTYRQNEKPMRFMLRLLCTRNQM